jgi:hypothetical protein
LLRQYQTVDYQQRTMLSYLRSNILNFLHTLCTNSSLTASPVHMPDEQVLNALNVINNDYDKCTKSLSFTDTLTPCELQTIIEFELYKPIPLFIQILLDGLTLNKEATTVMLLSNTTVHFDKIDHYITAILKQLERSYQLLLQALEKTSFQNRCEEKANENTDFLYDFAGKQSPLEFYSVYTEFISYNYSLYLAIKSILATLFTKTTLLIDNSENVRPTNTKKSKKKTAEQQQTILNESENELKLWDQLEKIEYLFNEQWTQITDNIRKYEKYLRVHAKLDDEECDRLEKELDGTFEQQSNR